MIVFKLIDHLKHFELKNYFVLYLFRLFSFLIVKSKPLKDEANFCKISIGIN